MPASINLDLKRKYMFALENAVSDVAGKILAYEGPLYDIKHIRGHEESNIDRLAFVWMTNALENEFSRFSEKEKFEWKYLFELKSLQDISAEKNESNEDRTMILRIDEIDGTTNVKRMLASKLDYAPTATVSIALCRDESLGSIEIGVVFDMLSRNVFSGMKVDSSYMTFCDRNLLDPEDFEEKKGDTSTRIIVAGYSNRERMKKAEIEQAIVDSDKTKKDLRIYGGSRSTTIDILNILRNQYDAYIDPRALWKDSGAMLYQYDVAGIIPIAYGCGLEVSDIFGNSIDSYNGRDEPLTLAVSRKDLRKEKNLKAIILEAIKPILKKK